MRPGIAYSLLDNLSRHFALQRQSGVLDMLVFAVDVPCNFGIDEVRDCSVDVRWLVALGKVDLLCSVLVTAKRSIMLQAIASAILLNRQRAFEFFRLCRFQSA